VGQGDGTTVNSKVGAGVGCNVDSNVDVRGDGEIEGGSVVVISSRPSCWHPVPVSSIQDTDPYSIRRKRRKCMMVRLFNKHSQRKKT
jgi:hypothetical protein